MPRRRSLLTVIRDIVQQQVHTPVVVTDTPVKTAVFPWVAAQNGIVDAAYYGTSAPSSNDRAAVWDVYLAQSRDGGVSFTQTRVSPNPNHLGPVCLLGGECIAYRQLADLFEVDIAPRTGGAVIAYVSDNLGHPFTATSGPHMGEQFLSAEAHFTRAILTLPDQELGGPTTYVGTAGCNGATAPTAPVDNDPNTDQIALVLGVGGCRFDAQAQAVLDAGYEGFVSINPFNDVEVEMAGNHRDIPGIAVGRTTGLTLLGVSDFSEVAVGTAGPSVSVGSRRPQLVLAQQTP